MAIDDLYISTAMKIIEQVQIILKGGPTPLKEYELRALDLSKQSMLAAVKYYKEATGEGLKEAKQAVDLLIEKYGIK